jgi:PAS domain S-box-containing protein
VLDAQIQSPNQFAPAPMPPPHPLRFVQIGLILLMVGGATSLADLSIPNSVLVLFDAMAAATAVLIGITAYARYRGRGRLLHIFLCGGFLGTGLADGLHMLVASGALISPLVPSAEAAVWTWMGARLFLATTLMVSVRAWRPHGESVASLRTEALFMPVVVAVAAGAFAVLMWTVGTPYGPPGMYRPLELLVALVFLVAFVFYAKRAPWRDSVLAMWIMISLVLAVASHLFMAFSSAAGDELGLGASVLRLASYGAVFAGYLADLSNLHREADHVANALRDANEQLMSEIRQRRVTEAALREHEHQLREAQSLARIGSWEWDIASDEVRWSDELFAIYGYAPGELTVDLATFLRHVHPDDRDTVRAAVERVVESKQPAQFHHRIVRRDAELRVLHARANVEADASGRAYRLWGTGQDVTDRWAAAEKLRESEARFRAVAETARDAIVSTDAVGHITYWNSAAEVMFGYTSDEAIGMPTVALLAASDMPAPFPEAGEVLCRRKTGDVFPVDYSLASWESGGETVFTAIVRDITSRRRAEDELQRAAERLEVSNRELEEFAYVASHDLQEPLRKVVAFGSRLAGRDEVRRDLAARDDLERMMSATARMQQLIDDLLTLSRVSTGVDALRRVDLNQVVAGVLETLDLLIAQTNARVTVADLPNVMADASHMAQLFQNLLTNALKFQPAGGTPVVTITADSDSRGPMVKIIVTDNGIGFDQNYLRKIFQPFQRLHGRGEYPGTGMGLAICRRIVERHGGSITASGTPGKGASFEIELPRAEIAETLVV